MTASSETAREKADPISGISASTVMTMVSVAVLPAESATLSKTSYMPGISNRNEGEMPGISICSLSYSKV